MRYALSKNIVILLLILATPAASDWAPAIANEDGTLDTYYEFLAFEPSQPQAEELWLRVDAYDSEGWLTALTVEATALSVARLPSARQLAEGGLTPCPGDPPDGLVVETRPFVERVRQADGRLVYSLHFRWTETCELGPIMTPDDLREASGAWLLVDQLSNFAGDGRTSELVEGTLVLRQRDGGPFDTHYLVITEEGDSSRPRRRFPLLFIHENGEDRMPGIELAGGFQPTPALTMVGPADLGIDGSFGWLVMDCRIVPCAAWSVQQAADHFSIVSDPHIVLISP